MAIRRLIGIDQFLIRLLLFVPNLAREKKGRTYESKVMAKYLLMHCLTICPTNSHKNITFKQ